MAAVTVTVGIPTFNRAPMLAQAMESVLAQTFTGFRLIISDNASTDATPDVVRSFDDRRIEYVRSERNVGAIANLNRLIGLADTDFLVLLPDDDLLYPSHLGACVELLQRSGTLGLAHTAFDLIDEDSSVHRSMRPLVARSASVMEPRRRALERLMVSSWPMCFPSVMYRTRAIMDAGGLREQDGHFCDMELWMRIALHWGFGYVARPLAGFRTHAESASNCVGTGDGAGSDELELVLLHARMRYERRMSFLRDAPIAGRRARSLRARARLQLLVEEANEGLAPREVATRLADVVGGCPPILSRPALWRLIVAELGGRRARSMLRATMAGRSSGGATAPSVPSGSP
ncbi:MAG TPA: glycosyltransferase family 2 protein [Solirubrobacteraceae bacterium]|nr:glycosyltransferase family 2 protein [Solirubrobacteraceae bacterium]